MPTVWCLSMCVCVSVLETDVGLMVSVRLEPQVSLPGGKHATHNVMNKHEEASSKDMIPAIKVDRFTVTNADFMYVHSTTSVKTLEKNLKVKKLQNVGK